MSPRHPSPPRRSRQRPASGLRAVFAILAAASALAATFAARADVWGYVDDAGKAHFASEKLDPRYQRFQRDGQRGNEMIGLQPNVSASRLPEAPEASGAKGTASDRLYALLDTSAGYQSSREHLRAASDKHGVDYALLQAVILAESKFDTSAVSSRGAVGLMQLMPQTARNMGVSADGKTSVAAKLADPKVNIAAGARYLRHLLDMFSGKVELALAAYNAGEGTVQRAGNQIPQNRETQNFVRNVMRSYNLLQDRPLAAATAVAGKAGDRVHAEFVAPAPALRSGLRERFGLSDAQE
jgi:soluble lytic murein transglycosylase-like protein